MTSELDLKRLQTQFQNYVRFQDDVVEKSIISTPLLDARSRLDIYRNAYYARFNEVLESDYPILAQALGEDVFYQLSNLYVDRYPSHYRSINDFGQHLSDFLAQDDSFFRAIENQTNLDRQFLSELSQFEWALVQAFNAENSANQVVIDDLAQLPAEAWPGLCFSFHASVQILPQHWNINAYWNAAKQSKEGVADQVTGTPAEEIIAKPQRSGHIQQCLIWRQGLITGFRSIDDMEADALRCLLEGESFSTLCDRIGAHQDDPAQTPMIAAGLLKTWVGSEMVTELRY